jgi:hypothetical protein
LVVVEAAEDAGATIIRDMLGSHVNHAGSFCFLETPESG